MRRSIAKSAVVRCSRCPFDRAAAFRASNWLRTDLFLFSLARLADFNHERMSASPADESPLDHLYLLCDSLSTSSQISSHKALINWGTVSVDSPARVFSKLMSLNFRMTSFVPGSTSMRPHALNAFPPVMGTPGVPWNVIAASPKVSSSRMSRE